MLDDAIKYQMENRVKRNKEGQPLCRRCGNPCLDKYRQVYYLPGEDVKTVWGPYCSDTCICHCKICEGCDQDFIQDKGEITFTAGKWVCKDCNK